jgi:hypothetical protein
MNIPDQFLMPVQAALEQWNDGREIPAADLESVLLFILHLGGILSQFGLRYKGYICRQTHIDCLMTVKVLEGDTPLVAFITSKTTTGCMVKFLDLLELDRLTWAKDKYPWI